MGIAITNTLCISTDRERMIVEVYEGIVINAPSIVGNFKNKPIEELRKWLRKQGGYREEVLCSEKGK